MVNHPPGWTDLDRGREPVAASAFATSKKSETLLCTFSWAASEKWSAPATSRYLACPRTPVRRDARPRTCSFSPLITSTGWLMSCASSTDNGGYRASAKIFGAAQYPPVASMLCQQAATCLCISCGHAESSATTANAGTMLSNSCSSGPISPSHCRMLRPLRRAPASHPGQVLQPGIASNPGSAWSLHDQEAREP